MAFTIDRLSQERKRSGINAGSVNAASFVPCGFPIVAKIAIPTSGAAEMADIAIR
jgi:hypothetical protein